MSTIPPELSSRRTMQTDPTEKASLCLLCYDGGFTQENGEFLKPPLNSANKHNTKRINQPRKQRQSQINNRSHQQNTNTHQQTRKPKRPRALSVIMLVIKAVLSVTVGVERN